MCRRDHRRPMARRLLDLLRRDFSIRRPRSRRVARLCSNAEESTIVRKHLGAPRIDDTLPITNDTRWFLSDSHHGPISSRDSFTGIIDAACLCSSRCWNCRRESWCYLENCLSLPPLELDLFENKLEICLTRLKITQKNHSTRKTRLLNKQPSKT